MRLAGGRRTLGCLDQALQFVRAILGFAATARSDLRKRFRTTVAKPTLPQSDGRLTDLKLPANRFAGQTREAQQNNPGSLDQTLWSARGANPEFELLTLRVGSIEHACQGCHVSIIKAVSKK